MAQLSYSVLTFVVVIVYSCWRLIYNYRARQVYLMLTSDRDLANSESRLISCLPRSMDVYQRLRSRTRDPGVLTDLNSVSAAIKSRA